MASDILHIVFKKFFFMLQFLKTLLSYFMTMRAAIAE